MGSHRLPGVIVPVSIEFTALHATVHVHATSNIPFFFFVASYFFRFLMRSHFLILINGGIRYLKIILESGKKSKIRTGLIF